MLLELTEVTVKNILTRTSGFLHQVTSHSLQPYRGCTFGNSLCGAGCYVQHSRHLLKGRKWGAFLEVRLNAAESYRTNYERERRYALRRGQAFSIFCSSSTDPFVPQETRFGITQSLLEVMCDLPPESLILQTHSHRVADYGELLKRLAERVQVRVHVSIETDRERLPGLPPPSSPVVKRMEACARLKQLGLFTVVTVAPLLPVEHPERFFAQLAEVSDAVIIDHFIQGDGSSLGTRTLQTALPSAMQVLEPASVTLAYRDQMVAIARQHFPNRVGVNIDGFAGRFT